MEKDIATELLKLGYGHIFLIPPDTLETEPMFAAQEQARKNKLGIWKTDRYKGALHMTSFHANGAGNDDKFVNGEYLRICNVTSETINLLDYKLRNNSGFTLILRTCFSDISC